jgi:hypothetical protein
VTTGASSWISVLDPWWSGPFSALWLANVRSSKTLRWRQVLARLDDPTLDAPRVARATTVAAERRLRALANDPTLVHSFWPLTLSGALIRSAGHRGSANTDALHSNHE